MYICTILAYDINRALHFEASTQGESPDFDEFVIAYMEISNCLIIAMEVVENDKS